MKTLWSEMGYKAPYRFQKQGCRGFFQSQTVSKNRKYSRFYHA